MKYWKAYFVLFLLLIGSASCNIKQKNNSKELDKVEICQKNDSNALSQVDNRQVMRELCKGTGIVLIDEVDSIGQWNVEVLDSLMTDEQNVERGNILINAREEIMYYYETEEPLFLKKEELLDSLMKYNRFTQKMMIVSFKYINESVLVRYHAKTATPVSLVKEIGEALVELHKRRNLFLSELEPGLTEDEICQKYPFIIITDHVVETWSFWNSLPRIIPPTKIDGQSLIGNQILDLDDQLLVVKKPTLKDVREYMSNPLPEERSGFPIKFDTIVVREYMSNPLFKERSGSLIKFDTIVVRKYMLMLNPLFKERLGDTIVVTRSDHYCSLKIVDSSETN